MNPINEALAKAGLTVEDIDQIELLGGGVRIPKVAEILQAGLKKDLSTHLNGDEAMCFGAAFIASNSSSSFKVKQVFLTQHAPHDVHMRISPLDPKEALTEDEQKAEGIEEADIIEYNQEFKLFNSSDYLGKSKGLNVNYNKNMKIDLFKKDEDNNEIHLDTFTLTDLSRQLQNEMDFQKKEKERSKKKSDKAAADKAKKAANETESEDKKDEKKEEETKKVEVEAAEDDAPIPVPKVKVSVEFTRSGIMSVTKAIVGTYFVNVEHVRKEVLLNEDQLRQARARLRWYENRDQDKIKTDSAMNAFESMIYKLRDWLREDDHAPYVEEAEREKFIEYLGELEEWLYEDGSNQNYTVYHSMEMNLTEKFNVFTNRRDEHEKREMILEVIDRGMTEYKAKLDDMKETKTWITDEERKDVSDKMNEI